MSSSILCSYREDFIETYLNDTDVRNVYNSQKEAWQTFRLRIDENRIANVKLMIFLYGKQKSYWKNNYKCCRKVCNTYYIIFKKSFW